jgi:hypothetical protein
MKPAYRRRQNGKKRVSKAHHRSEQQSLLISTSNCSPAITKQSDSTPFRGGLFALPVIAIIIRPERLADVLPGDDTMN